MLDIGSQDQQGSAGPGYYHARRLETLQTPVFNDISDYDLTGVLLVTGHESKSFIEWLKLHQIQLPKLPDFLRFEQYLT